MCIKYCSVKNEVCSGNLAVLTVATAPSLSSSESIRIFFICPFFGFGLGFVAFFDPSDSLSSSSSLDATFLFLAVPFAT